MKKLPNKVDHWNHEVCTQHLLNLIFIRLSWLSFRFSTISFCIALILPFGMGNAKNVTCSINRSIIFSGKHLLTCNIHQQAIDRRGIFIAPPYNSSVEAFLVINNKHAVFFPENLSKIFPRLEVVIFTQCAMRSVNNSFGYTRKLQILDLSRNKISSVAEDSFVNLVNLTELHLSFNEIKNLSGYTFNALKNLELLTLKGNRIQVLSDDIYANLINMRNISMSNNYFVQIPQYLFRHNKKLEFVWMQSNKIRTLSGVTFSNLPNLRYVDLRHNSCINKVYWKNSFVTMKNDLRKNCRGTEKNFIYTFVKFLLSLRTPEQIVA